MATSRRFRHPKPDRRRALELLASLPRWLHRSDDDRARLQQGAGAVVTTEPMVADGHTFEVTSFKITEAG
jgi:hypothetical protein